MMTTRNFVLPLSAMLLFGCVGGADVNSQAEPLFAEEHALPFEVTERWQEAPAGCEGRIDSNEISFSVASAINQLVAAINAHGEIVCVDSVESVEFELNESGHPGEADSLIRRFNASEHAFVHQVGGSTRESDPTPQPSCQPRIDSDTIGAEGPDTNPNASDPTPQPSSQPRLH